MEQGWKMLGNGIMSLLLKRKVGIFERNLYGLFYFSANFCSLCYCTTTTHHRISPSLHPSRAEQSREQSWCSPAPVRPSAGSQSPYISVERRSSGPGGRRADGMWRKSERHSSKTRAGTWQIHLRADTVTSDAWGIAPRWLLPLAGSWTATGPGGFD